MRNILPDKLRKRLRTKDFEELARSLSKVSFYSDERLILDLHNLEWIDLLPFAYLQLWLKSTENNRESILIRLPANPPNNPYKYASLPRACPERVAGFLAKWGFFDFCARSKHISAIQDNKELPYDVREFQGLVGEHSTDSYLFVAKTAFLHNRNAVGSYVQELGQPGSVFHTRSMENGALAEEEIAEHAFLLVEELGNNIFDHNEGTENLVGVACHRLIKPIEHISSHNDWFTTRIENAARWEVPCLKQHLYNGLLEFVIADNGKGVVNTLLNKGTAEEKGIITPLEVLKHAFERYSTRREKMTHRMRGLYTVLQHVSHVHGALFITCNNLGLGWYCFDGRITEPISYNVSSRNEGTMFQVFVPLRHQPSQTVLVRRPQLDVKIEVKPIRRPIKIIPIHPMILKDELHNKDREKTIESIKFRIREILENSYEDCMYLFDFRYVDWSRQECYETLAPIIDAWQRRVPVAMVNVSKKLRKHMEYSQAGHLFAQYHCILPVIDVPPQWIGLDLSSSFERELGETLTRCVQYSIEGEYCIESFPVEHKDYAKIPVYCADNTAIFHLASSDDGKNNLVFCMDVRQIQTEMDKEINNRIKQYIDAIPGVLSRKTGFLYELPGGGYTDTYIDLRGLFHDNPFASEILKAFGALASQLCSEYSIDTVIAYGEIPGKILSGLGQKNDQLQLIELNSSRTLDSLYARIAFDGSKVLILTDVIGLGRMVSRISERIEAAGGTPTCILSLIDAREESEIPYWTDRTPVKSLVQLPTHHSVIRPEHKKIVPFDRQKAPLERPMQGLVPKEVLLTPMQFWTMVQRSQSLILGHTQIQGRRVYLHVSPEKLIRDNLVSEYLIKRIQLFSSNDNPYDFVLLPSRTHSSAYVFEKVLKQALPDAQIVYQSSNCTQILGKIPGCRILVFDSGTVSGKTLSRLISFCPPDSEIDLLVFVDRMGPSGWQLAANHPSINKNRIAAFYRMPALADFEHKLEPKVKVEELRQLESWVCTHRMLEYLEELTDRMRVPTETYTEMDDVESSHLLTRSDMLIKEIDRRAGSPGPILQQLISLLEYRDTTSPYENGLLFHEHTFKGILRDISGRTGDPLIVLNIWANTSSERLRTELLEAFFLEEALDHFNSTQIKEYLPKLVAYGQTINMSHSAEVLIRVIAFLDEKYFLNNLATILRFAHRFERGICALSLEVARLLCQDARGGSRISHAIKECVDQLRNTDDQALQSGLYNFLENIGYKDPQKHEIRRLNDEEFFDRMVTEHFPVEIVCRLLTDHLARTFGPVNRSSFIRVSVWRSNNEMSELKCLASNWKSEESVIRTDITKHLTGLPILEQKNILIKNLNDNEELAQKGLKSEMVQEFKLWARANRYESLSMILALIRDRYGVFGICRVIKLWQVPDDSFNEPDLSRVQKYLERFSELPAEYVAAKSDLASAFHLQSDLAKIVSNGQWEYSGKMNKICEAVMDLLGVSWSSIAWLRTEEDSLYRIGTGGAWTEEGKNRVIPRNREFLSWKVIEGNKPIYSANVQAFETSAKPPMSFLRSCVALPLRDDGKPIGVLTVWSDLVDGLRRVWFDQERLELISITTSQAISQVVQQEESQKRRDQLYEQSHAQMIADVNHRIRNDTAPLASSLAAIRRLCQKLSENDNRELLIRVSRAEQYLSELDDHLKKLTRHPAIAKLEYVELDLPEFINDTVKHLLPADAILKVSSKRPLYIYGDKQHLQDMFSELTQNAIQARNQALNIHVRINKTISGTEEIVCIEFKDNGPGIALEHKDRIFRVYSQFGENRRGVGLGLYTVQQIVIAHGGSIQETGRPGSGAMFEIRLPINRKS